MQMRIQGQTSDGTVFFQDFAVSVLSAVRPTPSPEDGAGDFSQGGNSNLIAVIM